MNRGLPRWVAIACLTLSLQACGSSRPGGAAPTPAEPPPSGQLPEGVRPTSYRISLEVIPARDTFSGNALITIELDEPASAIWMHGERLEVSSIYATHATTRIEATWSQLTSDGVSRVEFREPLPAGRSTLHVEYAAPFDTPLRGLYRVRSGGDAYAFTQFESISARLAFPGFDEPRFKTSFELTLTVPGGQFAAANTPVDRVVELPNGLQRVSFLPTLPIPTYLVAMTVGPLDVVPGDTIPPTARRALPIPLRGIAARGKGPGLRFALDETPAYLEALERYFDIPYPYRKLDVVAVPDFASGAMENVGLITFREWLLLVDPNVATEGQRRAFAYVMAHELAHQWFGNLVTMPWWDDIWLNEAFATWMGNKVVEELHPEHRADLASMASAHRAMAADSLTSARSIRQPITSNHDIKNAFDIITYEKGGAVLSMFEHWMGPDVFREGIRLYLRRHRSGTATSMDLLAALDEASPLDVTEPFLSFLTQPGVPLLTSDDEPGTCEGGAARLTLRQSRDLPVGSKGDADQTWKIPLCVRHERGTTCGLIGAQEATLTLPGCPAWWMPNDAGAGYFRFSMAPSAWDALRTKGYRKLSDAGQMAVVDSVTSGFRRGTFEADSLLPWFSRFVRSPIRQVATAPMSLLRFMMYDAAPEAVQPKIQAYAGRLYRSRYQRLGWRASANDSSDTKLLRESVLELVLMDVRDSRARARAAKLGRAYVGYETEETPSVIETQLAGVALAVAVQESDPGLFDHLLDRLQATEDATTRNRLLGALARAEDDAASERVLDLVLDPRLRRNEIGRVLGWQFRNPRTRDRAWTWLTTHFDELVARGGSGNAGRMPWYAAAFCTDEAADEVHAFFEPRVADLSGGPRNLNGAVEAIRLCAARVRAQQPGIVRAFGAKRP